MILFVRNDDGLAVKDSLFNIHSLTVSAHLPHFYFLTDSKKRKLAFESTTKPGSKAASSKAPAARSNKARVEVEYEMEEEGERVPAQLRILAAQAAQANSRGGGGGGRSTRSVLKR